MRESDITLPDGRVLHAYHAAGPVDATGVCWHHGTSNLGAPPEPLLDAATRAGLRWFSLDRPGYGGSTREPGRTVGSVAVDAVPAHRVPHPIHRGWCFGLERTERSMTGSRRSVW